MCDLQALRRLAAIAGRPSAAVDLAQDVFRRDGSSFSTLMFLNMRSAKPSFLARRYIDLVVVLRLEDRLDDLLAPLERAVRRRARARALELRADRQQIGVVLALAERGPGGRMRIADDQQIELLHALGRFRHAGDGVAAMPEHHHGLHVVLLLDLILRQHRRVEPARRRNAGRLHDLLGVEAREHPVVVDLPDPAPMLPGALGKAVVERQRHDIETEVGGALHVAVAAEDVGAVAEAADIAGGEQQDAAGADVGGADRELGLAHRPDQRQAGFCFAKVSAMRLTCASGRPVTRSTSSGGHFSTSLRTSSMP